MKPQIIYIASPYTNGDVALNVSVQEKAAHRIMDLGNTPIWPLSSHYLHIRQQRNYDEWMRVDLHLLSKADVVIRLPGLSAGADMEVDEAEALGIPVAFGWNKLKKILLAGGRNENNRNR